MSHANYNNPSWGYLPRPLLCLVLGPPEPTSPRPVCTWPAFLGLSAPHRGPLMCPHLGCTPSMRPQSPGGVALGPLGAKLMLLYRCPQVLVMHPHPTTSRLVSPSWSQSPSCGRAPPPSGRLCLSTCTGPLVFPLLPNFACDAVHLSTWPPRATHRPLQCGLHVQQRGELLLAPRPGQRGHQSQSSVLPSGPSCLSHRCFPPAPARERPSAPVCPSWS